MVDGILVGLGDGAGGGGAGAGAVGPGTQCLLMQETSGQFPINGVLLGADEKIPVFVTERTTDDKGTPVVDSSGEPLWNVTFLGSGMSSRSAERPTDRVMRAVLLTAPDTLVGVRASLLEPSENPFTASTMRARLENLKQMDVAVQAWVSKLPSEVAKTREVDLAREIRQAKSAPLTRSLAAPSPTLEETASQQVGDSSKRARSRSPERRVRRKTYSHLLGENEQGLAPGAFSTKVDTLVRCTVRAMYERARDEEWPKTDPLLPETRNL